MSLRGFQRVKLKIGFDVKEDLALIRAVRDTIGPNVGLMIDANHGYDVIEAIELGRSIANLDIGWFEEPVVPDESRQLLRSAPRPTGAGGRRRVRIHALGLP